jgi:hypothetical protein
MIQLAFYQATGCNWRHVHNFLCKTDLVAQRIILASRADLDRTATVTIRNWEEFSAMAIMA